VAKADVAELVDARDLKSLDGNVVRVRVPPPAPTFERGITGQTPSAFGQTLPLNRRPCRSHSVKYEPEIAE
jgi:hypothetical protein